MLTLVWVYECWHLCCFIPEFVLLCEPISVLWVALAVALGYQRCIVTTEIHGSSRALTKYLILRTLLVEDDWLFQ